jgi:hypothetical protein
MLTILRVSAKWPAAAQFSILDAGQNLRGSGKMEMIVWKALD